MKKTTILWIVAGVVVAGAIAWGAIVSNVEQAKYDVAETYGVIEIRDYPPHIVAEVTVSGKRKNAINQGFRLVGDYIFGNNTAVIQKGIAAPDIRKASEKIAMTAPVTQQSEGQEKWRVRFIMPASYSLATLPKPNNPAVTLREVASKRYAVIRFSGIANEENIRKRTEELNAFIDKKKLTTISSPTFAFYNPPWTLPFLRRNEVMEEIEK